MKKRLFVMCGIPGSGKSTWIRNHLAVFPGYIKVVSRDDIRFSLVKEDEEYFSKEKEVFKKYIEEIKDGLRYCDTTVADATHLNEASRNKLLRALGSSLKNVEVSIIVIKTSLNTSIIHNANRQGTRSYVPRDAIKRMFNQLTMPTFEEGFDKIYVYNSEKEGIKYSIYERELN